MNKNYDKIQKRHYNKEAKTKKASPKMTMGDNHIRSSETEFILDQINKLSKKKLEFWILGVAMVIL